MEQIESYLHTKNATTFDGIQLGALQLTSNQKKFYVAQIMGAKLPSISLDFSVVLRLSASVQLVHHLHHSRQA